MLANNFRSECARTCTVCDIKVSDNAVGKPEPGAGHVDEQNGKEWKKERNFGNDFLIFWLHNILPQRMFALSTKSETRKKKPKGRTRQYRDQEPLKSDEEPNEEEKGKFGKRGSWEQSSFPDRGEFSSQASSPPLLLSFFCEKTLKWKTEPLSISHAEERPESLAGWRCKWNSRDV